MTKHLRSAEVRAKIAAIMPTPALAAKWGRRLEFEVSSSELVHQSLKNSATARRQAEMAQASTATDLMGDLVLHGITGAPPVGLLKRIAGDAATWSRGAFRSRADAAIAKRLTRPLLPPPLPAAAP
jgi:hypothetical protein